MKSPALPLPDGYTDKNEYVDDLLAFVHGHSLFQWLCGGVHILDFFAREPPLYEWLLDASWRDWFDGVELDDVTDLVLRGARGGQPPASLVAYLDKIQSLALRRNFVDAHAEGTIPRWLAVGMQEKKIHEVAQFSKFIERLEADISSTTGPVSHLVDFGSGQNYLGRTLASQPYNKHVIAVESKHANVQEARRLDSQVNLTPKLGILRNKKDFKREMEVKAKAEGRELRHVINDALRADRVKQKEAMAATGLATLDRPKGSSGSVQYVEHRMENGDLASVVAEIVDFEAGKNLVVMSIHSCGNLTHHGLQSIVLNPAVAAVAMVGCCFNLCTERLPAPDTGLPTLRPRDKTARSACDPHGFPMSQRFAQKGIHFNISARMMALQAPLNWTREYSAAFFTRHFYRAVLQKIFVDKGIAEDVQNGQPIVIGSLRKPSYASFVSYVRAAVAKLSVPANHHPALAETDLPARIKQLAISDDEIIDYECRYLPKKKQLSTIWTLMAYSAQLVEAAIVVDRWQWLKEQPQIRQCWVENVFQYSKSPRNLVVVGIKSRGEEENGRGVGPEGKGLV